ncbi:protein HESO1-like isoform X2 [Henckelia pumila]|uniref:protein HESO1-like isoform X2 n=1 Tax=Henckelia pumila TaxID=405737 RepID=UPI003C6E4585
MNGYNLLELTLRNTLCMINPSGQDWSVRFQIINELRAVVEPIESLRGATVEPFGSFVSNLFTRWGDLDISIEMQNGSYISSMGKKQKQSILEDVLKALRKRGGFQRLRFISNARVPIVKFVGSCNISCDISINNLSGQMKSKLLFWINDIDGRFRDLVLLVKEWAKAHRINESKLGTLNSYSLSLLIIFHLQTVVPAILPPLREIYPGNMVDELTGVRAAAEKSIEDVCAVNINRLKSDKSRLINRSSLSELFISFLAKVEDPFEQPANTARTVTSNQLTKILVAIQATREILYAPNQNQASLLSFLVGPHVLQLMTRMPTPNPVIPQLAARVPVQNHVRSGPNQHPKQTPRPMQIQKQFQRLKLENGGETNGSAQSSTSQRQQGKWRPRSESKMGPAGSDG